MKKVVLLTHNDLDALGCILNLSTRLDFTNIFYTNYANIAQIVKDVLTYAKQNDVMNLVIADVSFSDSKQLLKQLYSYFKTIVFIDHHLYPDGYFNEFPNMFIKHDISKCATKLCAEYCNSEGIPKLALLNDIINAYDIWKIDSKYFNFAQSLNDYFFYFKSKHPEMGENSILELADLLAENDYTLPQDFKKVTDEIKEYNENIYKQYQDHNLIKRSNSGAKITLIFGFDCFNYAMIKEMDNGQDFVIGIAFGIFKVRINQKAKYSKFFKNELRKQLTGTENTGHMDAFTYRLKGSPSLENIINECQKITSLINSITL